MKGIEVLINCLVATDCPNIYGLKDFRRNNVEGTLRCKHGVADAQNSAICKDCFKQALDHEYNSSENHIKFD